MFDDAVVPTDVMHVDSWVFGDILLKGFKSGFKKGGKSEIRSVISYQTFLKSYEFPRLA